MVRSCCTCSDSMRSVVGASIIPVVGRVLVSLYLAASNVLNAGLVHVPGFRKESHAIRAFQYHKSKFKEHMFSTKDSKDLAYSHVIIAISGKYPQRSAAYDNVLGALMASDKSQWKNWGDHP